MNKHGLRRTVFLSASLLVLAFYSGCTGVKSKPASGTTFRTVWLDELDVSKTSQGWGDPRANLSVCGNKLRIGGTEYGRGFGTHADGYLYVQLDGGTRRFTAKVGIDDEVGSSNNTLSFLVIGDEKILAESGVMKASDPAKEITADLYGVNRLILVVDGGADGIGLDHADWADARFEVIGQTPVTTKGPEAVILTPKPGPEPRINSAKIFGVRPGSPVLYTIAATGTRPMTYAAENLPKGLLVDPKNGRITGKLAKKGEYKITLLAHNALGKAKRELRLVVGEKICLTPPMGWNSWNCWGAAIDEQKIRNAAKVMVESGLIDHGWQYVNIDDCWMVKLDCDDPILGGAPRDENDMVRCNKNFPDMKALTDYIHSLGLKAGLYSSPGPFTCQRFEGSYQHEEEDAKQYAMWGFDYLKYDWCGYSEIAPNANLAELQKPYILMKKYLDKQNRDIVYSLCQYGCGKVWEWGEEVGGNCWRTTDDINDSWSSVSGIGFRQDVCSPYAGPGHWNDPDMLVVGKVGWGPNLHPTTLTPNEQYTHISLWCLLSAPLLIGCDMTDMDDFTLSLLTNDEVLEINQDPLGSQAVPVSRKDGLEVWAKEMEDGSRAVGLFNRSMVEQTVTARWSDLKLTGRQRVRDLWRQKDLGLFKDKFEARVSRHGVVLIRLWPENNRSRNVEMKVK